MYRKLVHEQQNRVERTSSVLTRPDSPTPWDSTPPDPDQAFFDIDQEVYDLPKPTLKGDRSFLQDCTVIYNTETRLAEIEYSPGRHYIQRQSRCNVALFFTFKIRGDLYFSFMKT